MTDQHDESPEQDLSYEQARDQLIEVVRTLEQGGTSLADSLALWERGERLADACQRALDGARARLDEVLDADQGAEPTTEGSDETAGDESDADG